MITLPKGQANAKGQIKAQAQANGQIKAQAQTKGQVKAKGQGQAKAQVKRFYYLILCVLFSFSGLAYAGSAMVVTADPRATNGAGEILRRGGSAVDAAIAAQMVLGLVEPQSSGIGGGAFLSHKVGWFLDRDNSMTPISSKEGVGAAMATVFVQGKGQSQAIQVCPGVYLATAHGVLDNPLKARQKDRSPIPPSESLAKVGPYPLNKETLMLADVKSYVSPRIVDDPNVWRDHATDYIFMKVDKPLKPNHFVTPVNASTKRMVEASNSGEIKIHRYRPLTDFKTDENGVPDFKTILPFSETLKNYQSPQKVNVACQHVEKYRHDSSSYFLGSSCPSEVRISGSPEITTIRGQNYLVGINIRGIQEAYDRFNNDRSNIVLDSSKFCKDYEAVCGAPCADLDEVLYGEEEEDTIPIEEEDTVPIKVPR